MGNASSSVPQSQILGDKLIFQPSQGRSRNHPDSSAYCVTGPRPQDSHMSDIYALETSSDSTLCCASTPRDAPLSFISREEALMKARYYKDRNPELAKQAYLFALSFLSTKAVGKAPWIGGTYPASTCGCSFVRCGIPQPVSSCWASSQPSHHVCTNSGGEAMQKMGSAEAMSTAFTSGTVSRMHTDDLDELVVHNPVAHRLHLGDVSARTSGKDDSGQFEDTNFRAEIYAELAQLHLMTGEPHEALECYKNAATLSPDQLAYSYRRGVVFQQLGERDKAISCFRNVLQKDPTYKPAIFNLGVCLAEAALTRAEALEVFELLLSIDPTNDSALDMIAEIHEQEGRVAEAYAAKQRVVALDPSNFRAGRDLARLETTLVERGEVPGYVTLN